MAGTLTHFYVMKKYFEKYEKYKNNPIPFYLDDSDLPTKEKELLATAFLGSTGPDLFYMPTLDDKIEISDFHHYKNPGIFVKNISDNNDTDLSKYLVKGFLCHIATDLVIHPFVNSLVGKYQEHIVKKVNIPGKLTAPEIKSKFYAHNIMEFAQDYYVQTSIFKINTFFKRTGSIFTEAIDEKRAEIAQILYKSSLDLYNSSFEKDYIKDGLGFYCDTANLMKFEAHIDTFIDDKYENYKIFLEHKDKIDIFYDDDKSTFNTLIDKAVDLTLDLITFAEDGLWDDIIQPLNLDTGLYTQALVDKEKNQININFNSFEELF